MHTTAFHPVAARRPYFGRVLRLSILGVALTGAITGALAQTGSVPAAAQIAPAPLLDKPLPPSTPDAVGDQPTPQHVYVSGHWRWQDGAYVWENGRWELPPAPSAVWVGPRWEQKDNGYVLAEGYWQEGADTTDETADNAAESIVVEQAPPLPEREIIIARPSPAHVWIGGYWGWHAGRHVWVSGRWDLPPRTGVVWVAPRWVRHGHGYRFHSGGWRDGYMRARTSVVVASDGWRSDGVVTIAPPPPRREVVVYSSRPSFDYVWVPGYWNWYGGRHVWISGRWDRPPHGRRHWDSPRWERRRGGYIFVEGRWR